MKKRTLRSITLVLVFCLVIPSFFAIAGATDYTPLRYDTSSLCSASLVVSSSNYAEYKVTFVVDVYDSNGTYIETLRATSDVLYV